MECYSPIKNEGNLAILEDVMLSDMNQGKDKYCMISLVWESTQTELTEIENRLGITRGGELGAGQMGESGQKIQASSYKIMKFWGCHGKHGNSNWLHCIVNLKVSSTVDWISFHHTHTHTHTRYDDDSVK